MIFVRYGPHGNRMSVLWKAWTAVTVLPDLVWRILNCLIVPKRNELQNPQLISDKWPVCWATVTSAYTRAICCCLVPECVTAWNGTPWSIPEMAGSFVTFLRRACKSVLVPYTNGEWGRYACENLTSYVCSLTRPYQWQSYPFCRWHFSCPPADSSGCSWWYQ